MSVEQLYQDIIIDHYREKHHSGLRAPFGAEVHHVNPSCGDEVTLRVSMDGDTIGDVSYDAEGCSISQASTSVMCDLVIGRDVADSMALFDEFRDMMESQGRISPTRTGWRTASHSPVSRSSRRASSAPCSAGRHCAMR